MAITREFREEALKLADTMGIPAAAKELGIKTAKLYGWRSAAKKKSSVSQRETELTTENAHLKRQLAEKTEELNILKKAAAYFAKSVHAG
ncbi:MAG: transposase [Endozoicomonas sp. (ex Botrylloides leachii)]|nr:transposase [Endozoicomonas sp. (ex Botrylloides leachii)]